MKRFFYPILIYVLFVSQMAISAETAESIYARAYGKLYQNDTNEAIKIFEKGITHYPDCAFLYAGMGDAYLKNGNLDKAINLYTISQTKKYSSEIYKIDFYNATLLKSRQNINNALDTILRVTKFSENKTLYQNINYLLNDEYAQTILMTEDFVDNNDAELKRINIVKNAGKKEDALRGYLQMLTINPNSYQAANNAGVTLIELKDYQLAEKYLTKAIELNPNSEIPYNNLGIVYLHLQNYSKMESNFNTALKLKNNYIHAINNQVIARIHKDIAFYKPENINAILDIIKKDNENYYATRTLAQIYFLKGDFKSAFETILPLNSNYNFKLYSHKASIALKAGEPQSALNYINNAITLYSDVATDYELKGRILTELGEFEEARENFQKALDKNKKTFNSYYYNALNFNKEGQNGAAVNTIKTFLSIKNGNPQSGQINVLLERNN